MLSKSEPRPVKFKLCNFTYQPPEGLPDVEPLPCFKSDIFTVSCWEFPSIWQRLKFLFTGRIWLLQMARVHPPTELSVRSPLTEKQVVAQLR